MVHTKALCNGTHRAATRIQNTLRVNGENNNNIKKTQQNEFAAYSIIRCAKADYLDWRESDLIVSVCEPMTE